LVSAGATLIEEEETPYDWACYKISLKPDDYELWVIFSSTKIWYTLYNPKTYHLPSFESYFDSIPDKYKKVSVFYLNLLVDNNKRYHEA
jgi:hypothetical protein